MKKFSRIFLSLVLITGFVANDVGPSAPPARAADGTCSSNGTVTEGDSGNYHWVKFTVTSNASGDATCTFRTPAGVSIVSVLSVSGGGGGGHDGGGGGGGGGVLFYDQFQLSENTNYSVTVGAGGAAAGSSCVSGNCPEGSDGNRSIFNDNYAAGGGGGGGRYSAGNSLGTGGGAGHTNDATVLTGGTGLGYSDVYTATYGRNAGNNSSTRGGGGGGAVTGGNNGGDADAGVGGKGFTSSIDGTSRVYGGGGGGGTYTGNARSTVNPGGGGLGGNSTNDGANGSDGFGGGGGGGGDDNNPAGRGGSGVVIVRYLTVDTCATPTPVTVGSEVYLKFVTTSESRSCLTNWSVPIGVSSVQLLVVGGGGSGGTRRGTLGGGGGGGAGGFRTESSFNVTAGNSISILVGGGGAAQTASIQQDAWGFDGNLSYFSTVIAQGGGGGGAYCGGTDDQTETRSNVVTLSINGRSGGSGGGGGRCTTSTGGAAANASYGNAGGSANATSVSGGGGGKGSAGNSGSAASNPGKGGDGATSTITGSTLTYAGGGGGSGGTAALGGSSIGGTGARENTSAATAGTSQTGSGGGGGYASSGAGGSGVVIVRYQPATCSPTSSTSNGYQYISFTTVTTCNWQIPSGVSSIDLLVVAGGGGGGYDSGGGGGGGGYAEKTGLTVTSGTTFTVAVGSGGAAATSSQSAGATGTSSSFGTYSATGGTGGGSCTYTGQGFNGSSCESRNRGGNRGTGTNGTTNSTATQSPGNGFCFSNPGSGCSAAVSASSSGWNASINSQTYSIGGGGGGSADANPTANTGSGGKGGGGNTTGSAGAAGVVIVRYSLTLNVTFNSQSGSAVSGTTVLSSATLPAPIAPTRSGYDFAGWSLTIGGSAVLFPFTHGKYEDFTLYARWTASVPILNSVTVAGTALGGSVITATPSATGLGTITYSYQWMRILTGVGTFQIDGATNSTYTLTDSDLLGYVYVNVIASNENGSSSTVYGSMPAEQKIGVATPTISGYLQSGHLLTGATTSTIPAGANSEYQWLRADSAAGTYTNISGATSSTYRLTSSDVGKYIKFSIVIRNISRGVTSIASTSSATNVVADIYTITYAAGGGSGSGPSTPITVIDGSTFTLPANTFTRAGYSFAGWSNGTTTYQAGETYPAASGNVSLTATWTANSLTITYNTQDGSAISPGSTTTGGSIASSPGTPTRTSYTFNGWFIASTGGSAISFPYTHGQTANFTLYAQWTAVAVAPTISSEPSSATKYAGQSVTFSVTSTASDSGTLSYQWKKNGTDISGATTATYTIASVASGDAGSYTVVVTNTKNGATATATSNTATLTLATATQLTTPNSPGTTTVTGSTTSIAVTYSAVANAVSHTVKVYAGGVLVGSAYTSFVSGSTITGLTPGTAYTVTVTAIGDGIVYLDSAESGTSSITTNAVAVTPTISTQPTSATKYAGQAIDFTVGATASDSGSLSYQWKKNGTDISGAQSSTLSINPISSSDAGDYTVVVTNSKNGTTTSRTSNIATLTFATAVQLSTPSAPTVSATSGSTTSITVSFTSVANASSHTVKVYASGVLVGTPYTSFTSGSAITNLSTNTAYTVTVTAIGDGTLYSDSAASSATSVTTNPEAVAPTISSQPTSVSKYTGQSVTFSVTASASDSGSLSYQWKVGGISISGATSATYTINSLSLGNAGDYTVVVTNTKNGTTTNQESNIATLSVSVQTYTVTYTAPDKSSGSVPVDSVGPYIANATVTLLGNTGGLTRGSYSFVGWRTASDPTVRSANTNYVITSDITFIAVWTEIYQLSFDANGGSGTMADLDGPTVTIPRSTFTRSGYTFSGWNSAANGSGFSLTIGQSAPLTQDVKIYAQWTQDVVTTNTITFASISNKSYGDTFSVTVSASSGLAVTVSSSTTSVCTVSTLSVTAISVGTCTLVASQAGNGTYPAATSVTNTFTVGKKSLVITASDQSGTVGNSTVAPSYSQSGLVSGDAIGSVTYTYAGSGSTRYTESSSVPELSGKWILGTFKITPKTVVLSSGSIGNYSVTFVQGTLNVSGSSQKGISGISVKSIGLNKSTELLTSFSASTTSYAIYVESPVTGVTVVISRESGSLSNAQVSVNDSGFRKLTFTSNAANSGVLALPQQSNTITVKMIATDLSVQTYSISILRDQATSSATGGVATPTPTATPRPATQVISSAKFFVNSAVGDGSMMLEISMTPTFSTSTFNYTLNFTKAQSATLMRTMFSDPGLTIRIKINQSAFRTIPSSGASTSLPLNTGANTAILRVLSADGTVADYTFTLNRAAI